MTGSVDFDAACAVFAAGHDVDEHEESVVGVPACRHFGQWVDQLAESHDLAVQVPDYLASKNATVAPLIAEVTRLLGRADVPISWPLAIQALSVSDDRREASFAAVDALYGLVSDRLRVPTRSRADVLPIMYLVEAVMSLEAWVIQDAEAFNYVPMGDVKYWWPYYLTAMDEFVSIEDLSELSRTAGRVTETEGLSSLTPATRLVEICQLRVGLAEANPNLPAEYVNSHLSNWDLLFHPNADPEESWKVIAAVLEAGDGEDLAMAINEFDNMRDDNWVAFAGFSTEGPHAEYLRDRIKTWCGENLDAEESEELLSLLGIDDYEEEDDD